MTSSMDSTKRGKQSDLKQINNMNHGDVLVEHRLRLVLQDCCVLVFVQVEGRVEAAGQSNRNLHWQNT
jgi:hypothetical protein